MAKNEKTGKRVGTIANKAIRDEKLTPRGVKSLGASALTQRPITRNLFRRSGSHLGHTLGDKPKCKWNGAAIGALWPLPVFPGAPSAKEEE
jgi:hypothetical protein